MEYLQNFGMFLGRILRFYHKKPPREITKSEAYLNLIYNVLTWKQPILSSAILLMLLILLWLVVQFEIKFFAVVSISILIILLGDYFLEQNLQLENEETTEHMQQIVFYITESFLYLKIIRNKYRTPYCFVVCILFLWLIVIAGYVSGVTLAYLGLITLFIAPTLISRLPSKYVQTFKEWLHSLGSTQVLAESELIPYLSNRERDNDMDSLKTDRTMDSLISGITSMPSYLEADKELDEDDLELPFRLTRESSTDTDSDKKSMEFESSHFNGDSSSEDEHRYHRGLKFSSINNALPESNKASGILTSLTSIGENFISNVLQNKPKRKDSDSDFEIIDSDEVVGS